MARTPITVATGIANNQTTITPTTLDPTNGHVISGITRGRRMVLRVNNTTASPKAITVKAGNYPPAMRAALGDLALTIPATTVSLVQIESARFAQADQTINIDVAAAMTGTIEALVAGPGNA